MSTEQIKPKVVAKEVKARVSDEDLVKQKTFADSLNAEKKKRDVQTQTVTSLEDNIIKLQSKLNDLVSDYNMKVRINENLGNSIASSQANLALFEAQFAQKNSDKLKDYNRKLASVESADKELQALLKENRQLKDTLSNELGQFRQEREQNRQLVHSANSALAHNNAIWLTKEADLLDREKLLAAEKAAFEDYKASLQPEVARITSIKNENTMLLQKIEMQNLEMERSRLASVNERQKAEEARAIAKAQVEEQRKVTQNEEARLRKWEQDLKDSALELRANKIEVDKIIYREKLKAEVDAHQLKEKK
jgi:hypothetical protein